MTDDKPPHSLAYRIFWLLGIVCVGCLLFLMLDVKHRVGGYDAVHGGVLGTAAITSCGEGWAGPVCKGDFTSADGKVTRSGIRVNGAPQALHWSKGAEKIDPPVPLPAAIGDPGAGEAWTIKGTPWLNLSHIQLYTLVPVLAVVLALWLVMRRVFGRRSRAYQRGRR